MSSQTDPTTQEIEEMHETHRREFYWRRVKRMTFEQLIDERRLLRRIQKVDLLLSHERDRLIAIEKMLGDVG